MLNLLISKSSMALHLLAIIPSSLLAFCDVLHQILCRIYILCLKAFSLKQKIKVLYCEWVFVHVHHLVIDTGLNFYVDLSCILLLDILILDFSVGWESVAKHIICKNMDGFISSFFFHITFSGSYFFIAVAKALALY